MNIHGHKSKIKQRRDELRVILKELEKLYNKRRKFEEDYDEINYLENQARQKQSKIRYHRFKIEELRKKKRMKR